MKHKEKFRNTLKTKLYRKILFRLKESIIKNDLKLFNISDCNLTGNIDFSNMPISKNMFYINPKGGVSLD